MYMPAGPETSENVGVGLPVEGTVKEYAVRAVA
jgi:hypothetical protein